jgi:hypothetical protein
MKTRIPLLLLLTFSFTGLFKAQEQVSEPIPKISVQEVNIQIGLFTERNSNGDLAEFKTLAPKSVLLNSAMNGYSSNNAFNLSSNTMFCMTMGIKFRNKQKTTYKESQTLRLGLSYFTSTSLVGGMYKTTNKPHDTLISNQTGQVIYLDSTISQNFGMNYTSQQLRLDASMIFRMNSTGRWSLYTGIGATAGTSINARTEIYYSSYATETQSGNNSHFYQSTGTFTLENIRQKNNLGFSAYVPLGLDFRLGRKREFWKRSHLFYEIRPGINMTSIPGLRTIVNVCAQHGIGFRVTKG